MDAIAYLNSLGLEVSEASRPAIGRLALAGEFTLDGERGVLLRPKRGDISDRYLEILASEGYRFAIVEGAGYPSFYAREAENLVPVRALPVQKPARFPSLEVTEAWTQLIRASAGRGDAAQLGVAQLVALLDHGDVFGPGLVWTRSDVPIEQLGGSKEDAPEPLRTAAALLAGYRIRPESPDELARLMGALSSLLPEKGPFVGFTEVLASLVPAGHLGSRRLLVSSGAGAELSVLQGARGTVVLPVELHLLEPVLKRLLPNVERVFADFLRETFATPYDGVVLIPPLGPQLGAVQPSSRFELSKRGGKVRARETTELLFVRRALAAMAEGGILVTVLPEGLLSSAGHREFREWLLEHARLLAVVSLPAGMCFRRTGMKCSVVLLRKVVTADDYPILMVDVEADCFDGDVEKARSKLEEFLEREVEACV